jgi:hypothetical protein
LFAISSSLVVVGLVATNALAVNRLYNDRTLHKPDYHGAAYRIHQNEKPLDVVMVDGPNPELVFNHYYQDRYGGRAPVHDLRPLAEQPYAAVSEKLQELSADASRVWEVLYFHAPGPVQFWLATHGWPSAPTDHNGIRVVLYGMADAPMMARSIATEFGAGLTLERAEVDGPTVMAGDLLRVTTHWRVSAPLPDHKFSLRLATETGGVLLADDYVPQNWFTPTAQWPVGEMHDQRALLLPVDLAPGAYVVSLRLYDPATGVAVDTAAGQDVILGAVEVE